MNERIWKLSEQATETVKCGLNGTSTTESFNRKKFAELIVRECVKHITDQQELVETNWQCKDGIHIVYSLEKHFGVEE